jgi:hypothetical protein
MRASVLPQLKLSAALNPAQEERGPVKTEGVLPVCSLYSLSQSHAGRQRLIDSSVSRVKAE